MTGETKQSASTTGAGDDGPAPAEFPVDRRHELSRRDPAALELFFDLYFPRIWGYVKSLVRDRHLAEDLTQDIFLQIHRGFASYDPERALRPWVFAVASNRMRDYWRSRGHRNSKLESSIEGEDDHIDLPDGGEGPLEPLFALENAEAVREAVQALPETLRETLHLRTFEELSFEEIGRLVGRNEVAVRKRYSRALAELRRRLGRLAPTTTEEEPT